MRVSRRKPVVVEEAPVLVRSDDDERLAKLLVTSRQLSPAEVDDARAIADGTSLVSTLVDKGVITDDRLARFLADQHDVPMVDFSAVTPQPSAVEVIPVDLAREWEVLPLVLDGVSEDADAATLASAPLVLALVDPAPERVAAISTAVGRRVLPHVATVSALRRSTGSAYKATRDVGMQVEQFEARDAIQRDVSALDAASASEDAPVVRVVQMIITQALRDRASDVHIEPSGDRVRVRYRIDGALKDVLDLPGSIGPALISRIKVLANLNIIERRRPQDGQISTKVEGRDVDIRVSTTAVVGGEKIVMRLLDKSRNLFTLEQLGMPADTAAAYAKLVHSPYGMVVCAGPTGGGKTTTLYASLGELNSPERNIMTIEDPVEYTFDSINQIQINEGAGITFAGGLRSILRQDPDVILVGEMRDVETARIAVQSALTGHLVLSSLHATEAVSALYRLLDMGIEGFLIASSVTAVVAQRLVRRNCPHCLIEDEPSAEEMAFLRAYGLGELVDPESATFRRGKGCHLCAHTGYLERIGVYELFTVTDAVRELIVEHASIDRMRKLARAEGMRTLQEQAVRLVADGTTTASEVMRSIYTMGA